MSVTAGEDSNAVDETVTLTHTVSLGGGYDGVVLPDLEVTVADNDGGIEADPAALTVAEGGTRNLRADAHAGPNLGRDGDGAGGRRSGDDGPGDAHLHGGQLGHGADGHGDGRSQDGDKNDETVTLRHAATGGGYAVAAGDARSAPSRR